MDILTNNILIVELSSFAFKVLLMRKDYKTLWY